MSRLNNYFMKSTCVPYLGEVYPIKLPEYEEFKSLANKYIISGRKWFTNIFKYPKDEFILDYYVKMALELHRMSSEYEYIKYLEENKNELEEYIKDNNLEIDKLIDYGGNIENTLNQVYAIYSIEEIEKLFSMLMRKKVTYEQISYDMENGLVDYIFNIEGDEKNKITKYNFEELRKVVMEQNLLYEPLTSPSEEGNQIIQEAIEALSKKGIDTELESICSVVSVAKGIGDDELYNYTYYRLMVDFESVVRINDNIFIYLLRSQGCDDAMPVHLAQKMEVDKNPYDGLIRKYKASSLDKRLKQG